MKRKLFFDLAIFSLFLSCNEAPITTSQAVAFYDSVNNQINVTKPLIQKFINKTTDALLKLKHDSAAIIDTGDLVLYLDSAKKMDEMRLTTISKINEVDKQINYKQKILQTEILLKELLENEFPKSIKIFGQKDANRFDESSNLLLPALKKLQKSVNDLEKTKVEFKSKYGFTAPGQWN